MTDEPDAVAGEAWRFPTGALVAATLSALGAGAALLLATMILGMGHGAQPPGIIWFTGVALLLGAAWLFWDAGSDIGLAPAAARTTALRSVGVLSYVLSATCVAVGAWALLLFSL